MSSGGGKASTPKLLDDNLKSKQFYRVLDLISEGPIYGPLDQSHLSSFKLNKTPVTAPDGTVNVNGVSVAWRPGSEFQSPINGFSAIEASRIINTEVKFSSPLVRTVTAADVTRVRFNVGVSGLVQQDKKGNQLNTSVVMVLETRSGNGAWVIQKTVTITGKISGEYLEAHFIDAPTVKPFDIRVRRITPDSTSDLLTNGTVWNSYTEITDDNLSYPFSALAGAVIDRDQYTDIPSRTYHLRGLIVPVPDNYNPVTRVYTGLWLGGFKQAWTNNPAWLFRELAKNTRFGLARSAGYVDVDDGALYILSQYCDQLVNDGYGGKEPRMTLNAYITEQSSARDILDKIAGMFRGIALWDGMRLTVLIDAPQDPIAPVSNASVVDGKFAYSSVKQSERFNAVVVSWTDPDNGWDVVKEYVSDDDLISRFRYNETTLEAFGCTSRGQAYRAGKWLLETAKRETRRVTFQMARDAIAFTPGDIVEVMDNRRAAARLGGRIVSHSGARITVDADLSSLASVGTGNTLSLMGAKGKLIKYGIASVSGKVVTLKSTPPWVRDGSVFVISTSNLVTSLYRITGIAETENNSVYQITAVQHDPNKQAIIDNGSVFEIPNDTLNGYRVPNIENLRIINTNSETVQVTATWETATTTKKLSFEVCVYTGSGAVVARYETDQFRYNFYGLNAGNYILGVRGRNENGMKGAEAQVSLIIGAPAAPSSVQWIPGVFQATLTPVTTYSLTSDTTFEYWYSGEVRIPLTSDIESLAQYLGRGHQWTIQNLKFDHIYYVYVRTRNAFGVSPFIEASGKPSDDFSDITNAIRDEFLSAEDGKALTSQIDFSVAGILQGTLADIQGAKVSFEQFGIARAEISQAQELIADANQSYAEFKDLVAVKFGDNAAEILTVKKAQATTDSAMALLTTTVQATTQSVDALTGRVTKSEASVVSISEAQTNTDKALATFEQQATAKFTAQDQQLGEQMAAINQKFTAYADATSANAIYTLKAGVKYNGNYYDAGLSVAVLVNNGQVTTRVGIHADDFVMLSGNGVSNMSVPFGIVNGQVFLNDAYIQKGSIGNLQIGNYIQSNDWDGSGNVGWHINKSGYATFNGVTVRGTVYATDGEFTGKINATSGSFKGTVEADSFVGDVANGQVFPDTGISSTVSVAFTYTDSGTQLRDKHIVLMAMISVGGATGPGATGGAADVTLTIGNVSKTYRVVNATDRGPLFTTLMVSARVRARSVACSITGKTGGISSGGSCQILSPSVIVARGSGAFEQTS
nr:MAG TPA_asm: tail protein [Caudoviricetes sp.]